MEGGWARRYSSGMTSFSRSFAAICAVLSLISPAFAGQAPEAQMVLPSMASSSQLVHIGTGDQVQVDVFDMPDLRTLTTVAADGTIRLPLVGSVKVAGLSPVEAGSAVALAYREGEILVEPHVTLTVVQSSSQRASVMGEVRAPGRYPIESNTTLLDLIALAGGIGEKGSEVVSILRPTESGTKEIRVDTRGLSSSSPGASMQLEMPQGGDTILVPKSVYLVNGEVTEKGEYALKGNVDLFQAIARAGGVTPLGSSSRIVIRRKDAKGDYIELKVNLKGKKGTRIEPDDVITVKERLF